MDVIKHGDNKNKWTVYYTNQQNNPAKDWPFHQTVCSPKNKINSITFEQSHDDIVIAFY